MSHSYLFTVRHGEETYDKRIAGSTPELARTTLRGMVKRLNQMQGYGDPTWEIVGKGRPS